MGATPEQRDAYIATFLEALPTDLRPATITRTINKHLATAFHNGWKAGVLAREVASGVGSVSNPVGLAVYRLGLLAVTKPQVTPTPARFVHEPPAPKLPDNLRHERSLILRRVVAGDLDGEAGAVLIEQIYERFALMQETDLG
jgi:hypothetical protein